MTLEQPFIEGLYGRPVPGLTQSNSNEDADFA